MGCRIIALVMAGAVLAGTVVAGAALAQAPTSGHAAFSQGVVACAAMTEGQPAAPALKAAGLVPGRPEPEGLQSYFFKDAPKVDWWTRPVSEGRVHVGYDPAKNQCRVFLMATPRGNLIQTARNALPPGWFAVTEDKTWARRRDDMTLSIVTILPGDEGKGIGPDTLTAMAHVWHNTAR